MGNNNPPPASELRNVLIPFDNLHFLSDFPKCEGWQSINIFFILSLKETLLPIPYRNFVVKTASNRFLYEPTRSGQID